MHKLSHALLLALAVVLAACTVVLKQRASGMDWKTDAQAWDFVVCLACFYVLVRTSLPVGVLAIQTHRRIRYLERLIRSQRASRASDLA